MIVVADTSVLLNLCQVRQEELLVGLFRDVVIPPEVAGEFARLAAQVPRFQGLSLPVWVRLQPACSVPASVRSAPGLDRGEIAALALAVEIHADAILVDERRGHQVAVQLGLKTVGVLGILVQAKKAGLLRDVRAVMERLEQDAQFWIGPDRRARVLRIAGEAT